MKQRGRDSLHTPIARSSARRTSYTDWFTSERASGRPVHPSALPKVPVGDASSHASQHTSGSVRAQRRVRQQIHHLDAVPKKQRRAFAYLIFVVIGLIVVAACLYALTTPSTQLPDSITLTQEPFQQYKLEHTDEIAALGTKYDIDPYLICAIINTESRWDAHAKSRVGAVGLMQMMPETAEWMVNKGLIDGAQYPLDKLEDPSVNMEYGVCYLAYLMNRFDNLSKVVAGYNGGPANVERWEAAGGADFEEVIDYPETKEYVSRVRASYRGYKQEYPNAFEGSSSSALQSSSKDWSRS